MAGIFAKLFSPMRRAGVNSRRKRKTRCAPHKKPIPLSVDILEERIGPAVVGYYDMNSGQGVSAQVGPINVAGHTPIQIHGLTPAELSAIDVLFVQNPDNSAFGSEYVSHLSDIQAAVSTGMTLIIHDRFVDQAESILPGGATFNILRDFSDASNINVLDPGSLVANGPGGVVTNTTLDGGNASTHGFAIQGSLPGTAHLHLSTGDPTHIVTFSFNFGVGHVIYSSIPLDYYLAGNGPTVVSSNFRNIYAPNVIAYGASLHNHSPSISADNAIITVSSAAPATNSGTFSDADAGDVVTLAASIGTVTWTGTNSGTWTWSLPAACPPGDQTVTITATDSEGATATVNFVLNVIDPPFLSVITAGNASSSSNKFSISADGRYVAFHSLASDLVGGDTNGLTDVFVYDQQLQNVERVSVASSGAQGNGTSSRAAISGDGRYVTFHSSASNLLSAGVDTNGFFDVFVHDRQSHTTERVSVGALGLQGDSDSFEPSISGDGRYVGFRSVASNLVGGDTNAASDIFVHDRQANTTERVSVGPGGAQSNGFSFSASISTDGRYVAFDSSATSLVSGDTNGASDVFVHDRQAHTTERVSVGAGGLQGDSPSNEPAISSDGRYVAFYSHATNLVSGDTNGASDVFVHDRQTPSTERVSVGAGGLQANSDSFEPAISGDGRYVAFRTSASNLVSDDTNGVSDVFVYDRQTQITQRISVGPGGLQGNGGSVEPSISADGRFVAFVSSASNLVSNDTNGVTDVFVADLVHFAPPVINSLSVTSPINENDLATLTGGFTDPDMEDTHTVTINWGDPNNAAVSTFALPDGCEITAGQTYNSSTDGAVLTITSADIINGTVDFSVQHRYLDDGPAPGNATLFDVHTINVTVSDDAGGIASTSSSVTTNQLIGDISNTDFNTATTNIFSPVLAQQLSFATTGIAHSHGGSVGIFVEVHDPSTGAWTEVLRHTLSGGAQLSFSGLVITFPLQLVDQVRLNSTPGQNQSYHGWGSSALTIQRYSPPKVTVNNVAPADLILNSGTINENDTFTLTGSFADPGTLDVHTVTINWGPGEGSTTFTLPVGQRTFSRTHQYRDDNPTGTAFDIYPITVSVSDDDAGTFCSNTTVAVNNVAPSNLVLSSGTIYENDVFLLTGSFDDPGTLDVHTVTINWGPGEGSTTLTLPVGQRTFSTSHQYVDDNPTATALDIFAVSVTVGDDDLGEKSATTSVTVRNVEPAVVELTTGAIDEDGSFSLAGSISDPGTLDSHTVTVDWGDGNSESFDLAAGVSIFTGISHRYVDDGDSPGNSTPSDAYTIRVSVTDDDMAGGPGVVTPEALTNVTVNNVAPSIGSLLASAADENGLVTLTGKITDPGTQDTFTMTVDWGDPLSPNNIGTYRFGGSATGEQEFAVTHQYLDDNPSVSALDSYTISMMVTDDDTGVAQDNTAAVVHNLNPALTDLSASSIFEAGVTTLSGIISDLGTLDTFTLTVDWGDPLSPNNIETYNFGANASGSQNFSLTHQYLDHNPTGGADHAFTINVTATDDDTGSDSAATAVSIHNLVDLSGRVFDDANNDGLFNGADAGLADVALQLFSESDLITPIAATTTDLNGYYAFEANLPAGAYRIVEAQPTGYLDGIETAGGLGGTVDNSQDRNVIHSIVVHAGDADAGGYNFAEIRPSRIQGLVWDDANNDGFVNFGEQAIGGVTIHLTGTDDRGNPVSQTMVTDSQGIFEFVDLRPSNAAGYTLTEEQPSNYLDGIEHVGTVNGLLTGSAADNVFSQIAMTQPGSDGVNYNFGERQPTTTAVHQGQTATIGFWQNKNGQQLIKSLNGGPSSTQLAEWLAATFPNMYGATAGPNNLTGKTNEQVAALYVSLFKRTSAVSGPPKLDAQVLAVALAVYVTNENLAGTTATAYGFEVSTIGGLGTSTYDVGDANRAAFGLSPTQSTVMSVMDILLATNARTRLGLLYDTDGSGAISSFEKSLREMANAVYTGINEQGHI